MPRTLRLLFGVSLLNLRALFGAVLLFSVLGAVPSIVLAATAPGKTYVYDSAIGEDGVSIANNVTADLPFALFDNPAGATEETLSAADVLAQRGTMIGEAGNSAGVRVVNSEAELNSLFEQLSKGELLFLTPTQGRWLSCRWNAGRNKNTIDFWRNNNRYFWSEQDTNKNTR
jgi:hypothetical protein